MRLKLRYLAFLTPFILASLSASGQSAPKEPAFRSGEQLSYIVSYKLLLNADIAEIVFNTADSDVKGVPAFRINAVAQVYPTYKNFFDMRDEYTSWLSKSDLKPLYAENNIKEGSYKGQGNMTYDWSGKTVTTWWRNERIATDNYHTLDLNENSFDGLSLFFNLRSLDLSNVQPGFSGYIDLVLSDTVKRLQYKFLGREVRSVSRMGKYNTLKFSCQLTTSESESFEDGSEFYIWLSDDANKIPIYLESPIRVGSVRARISGFKNLKHPLNKK